MNFLDEIDGNTLIICNNSIKRQILLNLSKTNKLLNIKFLSLREFYQNYFFDYNIETNIYIKNKYQIKKELASIYLDNLKYIINSSSKSSKIKFLKDLYQDLKDNNLLKFNKGFKKYLSKTKIIVLEDYLDNFTIDILKQYNYKILKKDEVKRINNITTYSTDRKSVE